MTLLQRWSLQGGPYERWSLQGGLITEGVSPGRSLLQRWSFQGGQQVTLLQRWSLQGGLITEVVFPRRSTSERWSSQVTLLQRWSLAGRSTSDLITEVVSAGRSKSDLITEVVSPGRSYYRGGIYRASMYIRHSQLIHTLFPCRKPHLQSSSTRPVPLGEADMLTLSRICMAVGKHVS